MNKEQYIRLLNSYKEKFENDGTIDPVELATKTNMNATDLICLLFSVFTFLTVDVTMLRRENAALKERIQVSDKALKEAYANPNKRQNALVKHGLKVKPEKITVAELQFYRELNYTDADIMKETGISRSTLWRKQKALDEQISQCKR